MIIVSETSDFTRGLKPTSAKKPSRLKPTEGP